MSSTISPASAPAAPVSDVAPAHLTWEQVVPLAGNLPGYLASFERHLRLRNRSPRTIETYAETARQFIRFLVERGMPTEGASLRREHVEAYIEWLQAWATPGGVSVRYRSIQQFLTYLADEGECATHPMAKMHCPTVPEKEVPVLTGAEAASLLDTARSSHWTDRRDLAMMRLFLDAGLRLAEMVSLKVSDLDVRTNTVFVEMGKGRKPRTAAYGDRTAQALERYLRVRAKHNHAGREELWLAPRGPFGRTGVAQMLWKRSEEAGIGKVHPHQLRHTAAHRAASKGMQETDMMRLFGWRSSEMPKLYGASAAGERAVEAYRRLGIGDDM